MSGTAEAAASVWPPVTRIPFDEPSHVLDVAAAIMLAAERDGYEMFVAKLHFLCYQVQGWTLACTGRPAFAQTIYAVADGVRIDEIRDAYAVFGEETFTLQDAIDAGIVTMPSSGPAPAHAVSAGNHEITQQ